MCGNVRNHQSWAPAPLFVSPRHWYECKHPPCCPLTTSLFSLPVSRLSALRPFSSLPACLLRFLSTALCFPPPCFPSPRLPVSLCPCLPLSMSLCVPVSLPVSCSPFSTSPVSLSPACPHLFPLKNRKQVWGGGYAFYCRRGGSWPSPGGAVEVDRKEEGGILLPERWKAAVRPCWRGNKFWNFFEKNFYDLVK